MEDVFFDIKLKQDWRGQKMERRQKKKWLNLWPIDYNRKRGRPKLGP